MSVNITMPALSPTMEEGNLAKWLVKEGDTVSAGDVIAEIETDKATMEVEAVDEGVVAKLMVPAGTEGVKVNAVIAVLAEEGEDASDIDAPQNAATEKPAETPHADDDPKTAPAPVIAEKSANDAKGHGKPDVSATSAKRADGERIFATPLARRIAEQKGVDLASISGSGPRGRIVKADVENAQPGAATKAAASGQTVSRASGMSDDQVLALYDADAYEKKPHDGMRKVIAERLTESAQTIPSYFVTMECELDALLALRAQINAGAPDVDGKPAFKISVNDFIVKAMAHALQAVPMSNVSWTSTDRIYHKHSDVGVAVAVEDGLFTPIVRKAETKSLSVISAEVKDMAGRARSKKLKPEEYQGGSTAVSNLGMFGVREFTSIINPPHASIVSIGAGEKKAVVKSDGTIGAATLMAATFAFDHRAIDGALGAELASAFKRYIENPTAMLV
ncbi:pyruvate dehydrogenase complex dihydrolipoamide acetyltransferase [Ahrensia sp. R2A130]|uniref:pyruvate dehydrogenase complex dihydrolipoamide acetyltransferase n=1 Tax=Ahrensia sp. R2A130 TaxID=744979 RepID=UPI0001E0C2FB|nr:pyruvate dehydrogenase complex dihydrolipoamide acetyltransferase [Ahrensia sp. R2A130]EFL90204.1 pyruvate dehydrogenase complex dihydrolipoamide acetyltransferase [Ahrensia sp. R2A130]